MRGSATLAEQRAPRRLRLRVPRLDPQLVAVGLVGGILSGLLGDGFVGRTATR